MSNTWKSMEYGTHECQVKIELYYTMWKRTIYKSHHFLSFKLFQYFISHIATLRICTQTYCKKPYITVGAKIFSI